MNKLIIVIILASVYGCKNETKCKDGYYIETVNDKGKTMYKTFQCTNKNCDTVIVLNCKDWQSDSTVSMKRRELYKYWQTQ